MNVVDSCGWLEYFGQGPNASFFAEAIDDVRSLLVPTVCLTEVFKIMHRQRGENAARDAVGAMLKTTAVPLDPVLAVAAAQLGLERDLPLADSVIYATARSRGATLWSDGHYLTSTSGIDGVEFVKVG